MAASVFDSPLYAGLFPTGETGRLFSDSAALRAMLLTEGALAKAQVGGAGRQVVVYLTIAFGEIIQKPGGVREVFYHIVFIGFLFL